MRALGIAFTLLGLAGPVVAAEPPKKPNVVFLLADDMRADTIAALGNPVARTPHLDALVGRGFTMTNAYCTWPCARATGCCSRRRTSPTSSCTT